MTRKFAGIFAIVLAITPLPAAAEQTPTACDMVDLYRGLQETYELIGSSTLWSVTEEGMGDAAGRVIAHATRGAREAAEKLGLWTKACKEGADKK